MSAFNLNKIALPVVISGAEGAVSAYVPIPAEFGGVVEEIQLVPDAAVDANTTITLSDSEGTIGTVVVPYGATVGAAVSQKFSGDIKANDVLKLASDGAATGAFNLHGVVIIRR